jgi:hypothetical protein
MKRNCLILLMLFPLLLAAQKDSSTKVKRVGVFAMYDYAFNFPDKLISAGIGRKLSAGISFTNRAEDFLVFAGGGLKGFKFNFYSPAFQKEFLNDVSANYIPVGGNSLDNAIAVKMSSPGNFKGMWGTYSNYLQAGIMIERWFRPYISFYWGSDGYLLHDSSFPQYVDPEYHDIDYVSMNTRFYELKLGGSLPQMKKLPFLLNFTAGYKWNDYGNINFDGVDLSVYTKNDIAKKYNKTGQVSLSLTAMIWSNYPL